MPLNDVPTRRNVGVHDLILLVDGSGPAPFADGPSAFRFDFHKIGWGAILASEVDSDTNLGGSSILSTTSFPGIEIV